MPVKNISQRQGMQAASNGTDSSPKRKRKFSLTAADDEKKGKEVTGSFEVYQSEAATFQNIGHFRKAINSYTTVSKF